MVELQIAMLCSSIIQMMPITICATLALLLAVYVPVSRQYGHECGTYAESMVHALIGAVYAVVRVGGWDTPDTLPIAATFSATYFVLDTTLGFIMNAPLEDKIFNVVHHGLTLCTITWLRHGTCRTFATALVIGEIPVIFINSHHIMRLIKYDRPIVRLANSVILWALFITTRTILLPLVYQTEFNSPACEMWHGNPNPTSFWLATALYVSNVVMQWIFTPPVTQLPIKAYRRWHEKSTVRSIM